MIPLPRRIPFEFSTVPKHWFADNVVLTHRANALHLLFPEGERFFIRSVRYYADQIEDPELKKRIRGFYAQEGLHGKAHDDASRAVLDHGFEVDTFLRRYRFLAYRVLERVAHPALRLSTTVALEHLTACMAELAFTTDHLDHCDPVMADLLKWHAAEEIEHKSVAFDVFQEVDGRWWVRALGMVLGLTLLQFFWAAGMRTLIKQDGADAATLRAHRKQAREMVDATYLKNAINGYFRHDFHPDEVDNYHLAHDYFSQAGLEVA